MNQDKFSESKKKRSQKIDELRNLFKEVEGGILTNYRGLTVAEITDLRRRFRERGATFRVVKNTLTRIAVKGTAYQGLEPILAGPTGIAFGRIDPIAAARVAVEFSKDHQLLEVKGGFMEGQVLTGLEVVEISRISGKKDLMAQFLSIIEGPSARFLGLLNGVPQKFLGVLMARSQQIEGNQAS